MSRTYTIQNHNADGTVTTETLTMSPEMERISDEIAAFNVANPNFWCRCGNPETGRIEPRGHSVDVFCKNCGGCTQVG
jgi:hypothetical protein